MCKRCKKEAAPKKRSFPGTGGIIAILAVAAVIAVNVVVAVRLMRRRKMYSSPG